MARGRVISICNIFDFEFGKKTYSTSTKSQNVVHLGLISLRKLHSMLREDYNATYLKGQAIEYLMVNW